MKKLLFALVLSAVAFGGHAAVRELTPTDTTDGIQADDDIVVYGEVTIPTPLTCKSLTLKKGAVLTLQAAAAQTPTDLPSVFTDATLVSVSGELAIENGARLRPLCDKLTGAPIVFRVGSFTLEYGGIVCCDEAGYAWLSGGVAPEGAYVSNTLYTYAPGWPSSWNTIAAHGGNGQKAAYGYKYAPFLPGSPGSTINKSTAIKGGGAFVLFSSGVVSLSGLVTCRSSESGYGSGSGGGIWIVGPEFWVAPCAQLVADSGVGGAGYSSNYAGTGGRISLGANLEETDIAALARGETPDGLVYADTLDFISASANAGGGGINSSTGIRYTANRPGTLTYVTRGDGPFVTEIPAPPSPPSPVYPDPAGDGSARTFVGADGGDWDDPANWSPSGVPGNADPVTIDDGKWVMASGIVHAASLEIGAGACLTVGGTVRNVTAQKAVSDSTGFGLKIAGNLKVAGDLSIGGVDSPVPVLITVGGNATVASGGRLAVYAANGYPADPYGRVRMASYDEATVFNVAGAFNIDAGATVYPDADIRTGAPVRFKAQSILLAEGGRIDADARGFGYVTIPTLDMDLFMSNGGASHYGANGAYSPGSGPATYGKCGGYGGTSQGARYGLANAPFLPGSPSGYYPNGVRSVRGGGSVWLDAMQATLHGTITAIGTSFGYGQSSGGGVWIVAKAFVSSPTLEIHADGCQNGVNGYGTVAAGGRVALGIALTAEEEEDLVEGTTPGTVTEVTGVVGFTATVNGGTVTSSSTLKGNVGTIKTVTGSYVFDTSVEIVGSPLNAVSPVFSYGMQVAAAGSSFSLPTIGYGADPDDPLVRYPYAGWRLTDEDGEIVASGTGDVSFTVPQGNSTLTILWSSAEAAVVVSVPDPSLGSVSVGGVSHDADFTVFLSAPTAFTAVPAAGAEFLYWVGETPAGHACDNPLTIPADAGRRVWPVFRSAVAPTTRDWTGAAGNGLWLDAANWSPEGVPGLDDTVTMSSGLVVVTNFVRMKALALSGTARLFAGSLISLSSTAAVTNANPKPYADPVISEVAVEVAEALTLSGSAGFALGGQDDDNPSRKPRLEAGSIGLSGSSLLMVTAGAITGADTFETGCGTVTVRGVFSLADTAQFVPASDQYTGGSLVTRAKRVVLGASAKVNAGLRGFRGRYFKSPQILAPGKGESYTRGGGYGGLGGNSSALYGQRYGFMYAPIHPGSCNGMYNGQDSNYPAGGLIRIHAGSAVLEGTLDAGPAMVKAYGGPSGGGIWVTTSGKMEIGAAFAALAPGGTSNYSSGGGGGRIALGEWLTDAEVAQLAVDGVLPVRGAKQKPIPVLTEAEFEELHPGTDINVTATSSGGKGTFAFLNGRIKGLMLLVK